MKTVIFDQSHYRHLALTGEDRIRFLNGMVTSDVATLQSGQWQRTMTLTHKARIISLFEVFAEEDRFVLSMPPDLFDKTASTLEGHIVMDDVELDEIDGDMHSVWESPDAVWTHAPMREKATSTSSAGEVEARRIEAGLPSYGVDVSEDNFPFETPLVRLVNYQKGCFTGQEPVARVKARGGSGNKHLCGLRGQGPIEAGLSLHYDGKEVGQVRSASHSEALGPVALGYVHKSAWEPGTQLSSERGAIEVVSLPMKG